MSVERSENMLSKIVVGVAVAVISTIIIANLDLGRGGDPSPPYKPGPDPIHDDFIAVEKGKWCCDIWGNRRCQLVSPLPVGTACFCPGQGAGTVCP